MTAKHQRWWLKGERRRQTERSINSITYNLYLCNWGRTSGEAEFGRSLAFCFTAERHTHTHTHLPCKRTHWGQLCKEIPAGPLESKARKKSDLLGLTLAATAAWESQSHSSVCLCMMAFLMAVIVTTPVYSLAVFHFMTTLTIEFGSGCGFCFVCFFFILNNLHCKHV